VQTVGDGEEINFEAVAALAPDLILGVYSGMTEREYSTLSQIAPTVAQTDDFVDFGVPWQQQTMVTGRTLGRRRRARHVRLARGARRRRAVPAPRRRPGREVIYLPEGDSDLYGALAIYNSPLSLPLHLEGLVPRLAAAVDGDPATEVARIE
jgi:iron complex transport system substrate-binding protein